MKSKLSCRFQGCLVSGLEIAMQKVMGHFFVLFVVIGSSTQANSADTTQVLEQIAAAVDANIAKIGSGRVIAEFEDWHEEGSSKSNDEPKPLRPPEKGTVEVCWKPGCGRLSYSCADTERNRRYLYLSDKMVMLHGAHLGTDKQMSPDSYTTVIMPAMGFGGVEIHPRFTGVRFQYYHNPVSLADYSRYWQSSSAVKVKVESIGENRFRIEADEPSQRGTYVSDLGLAGNIVSCQIFSKFPEGERLGLKLDADYEKTPDGIVYVSRLKSEDYTLFPNGKFTVLRQVVSVKSADFSPLSDDEFTLAGLGLPVGSRIKDNLNGGEITYFGVEAPSEAALDKLEWKASGPRPGIDWWFWGGVVLGVVGLGVGAWSWRKTKAA